MTSTEEMICVMQAYLDGEPIECRLHKKFGGADWKVIDYPSWNWYENNYRIARRQDSIDWAHVVPEFKWMARDELGKAWLFTRKPEKDGPIWAFSFGICIAADNFASYRRGNTPWDESLVKRPEEDE